MGRTGFLYAIGAALHIDIQSYFPPTLDFSVSSLPRIIRGRVVRRKTQPAFTPNHYILLYDDPRLVDHIDSTEQWPTPAENEPKQKK